MAAYVDYAYYTGTYNGTAIAESAFSRLAIEASREVDLQTLGRAAAVTDETALEKIKLACCAIAEILSSLEQTGGAIQSESIGRHSVSYVKPKTREQQISQAAKRHLWDTGLMYRGLDA